MNHTTLTYGFLCLTCSMLLLAITFAWWLKPVVIKMRDMAVEMVPTHALAYLKCLLGTVIAGGICFRETWQPVTIEQAANFAPWDWMIYIGAPGLAMLLYVNAFLDRSLERADKAKAARDSSTPSIPVHP